MGSIISFPSMYPDEDFRSILFRYQLRSPHVSYLKIRKELLGKAFTQMIIFPENLMSITTQLGVSKDFILNVIDNHSFYPFFRPFVNRDLHNDFTHKFYFSEPSRGLSSITKDLEKQFLAEEIRYCSSCLLNDYEVYGEVYLHRTHQFSFLTVCPVHEIPLIHSCSICNVPFVSDNANLMLIEPKCPNGHDIIEDNKSEWLDTFKYEFLDDIQTLMEAKNLSLNYIFQKLMVNLGNRGYIHFKGGTIYKKNLIADVIDFYGREVLGELGLNINELLRANAITNLFVPDQMRKQIVFYILLMRFFSGSVTNFLKQDESYFFPLPFGLGPWVCNNRICPFFNQKVINKCKRKVHEWITGYFTCEHCGMTYYRKGFPSVEDESRYSIETMGSLFTHKAIIYFESGININQIAELLQNNRRIVRKYLKPYRMELQRHLMTMEQKNAHDEILQVKLEVAATTQKTKLELCKETVLEAIRILGEGASRPQIRRYNIHRYDWIMKHDRVWMECHLPARRKMSRMLNLETLDDEMYQLVSAVVPKIWENLPQKKITKKEILKELPSYVEGRLRQYSDYLPKTIQLMENSLETDDHYLVRNFPHVVDWFNKSRYKKLSLKLIQNNFKSYKKCSLSVIQWVEGQIDQINNS
ncbi:TnsD family Tn7-like transposition protein [Sporosarcina sp. FSL K6-1522]|uniref:TnsD family Tn7-like transposition protein n=1 Tax=Sporosarcina sp. FSL K6-1522 TaxID=2921554 RepID=UPI003159B3A4